MHLVNSLMYNYSGLVMPRAVAYLRVDMQLADISPQVAVTLYPYSCRQVKTYAVVILTADMQLAMFLLEPPSDKKDIFPNNRRT